jgi:hypothetical protein
MEERWEALEELEELTRGRGGRARLLSRGDHVELFEAGALAIVRVGRTDRFEEAWWRYGRQLERRGSGFVNAVWTAAAMGVGAAASLSARGDPSLRRPAEARRWLRFGSVAWRGREACPACGFTFTELPFFDRKILVLRPDEDDDRPVSLSRRCPRCKDVDRGGLHLHGAQAEWTLRRVLAYEHDAGHALGRIRAAMGLIERAGRPSHLARVLSRHGRYLGDLPATAAIAMEIAANEAAEQRMLTLEASALDRYWQEAEELASIVDGELTPAGSLERLRRKLAPRS